MYLSFRARYAIRVHTLFIPVQPVLRRGVEIAVLRYCSQMRKGHHAKCFKINIIALLVFPMGGW